jgi:hypothetical protein
MVQAFVNDPEVDLTGRGGREVLADLASVTPNSLSARFSGSNLPLRKRIRAKLDEAADLAAQKRRPAVRGMTNH